MDTPTTPTERDPSDDTPQAAAASQEPRETPQERDPRDDRIAELERQLAQKAGGRRDQGKVRLDMADLDQSERSERYGDWPSRDSDLPQPWDHRALNLTNAERDFLDQESPGAANTVSPIVVNHGRPILSYGASDPSVQELGRILGALGFRNSVSDGRNPFGSVDDTVMGAVHAFRDAYNVQEDPSGWGGDTPAGRDRAGDHIGPWTWEAILRAGANELQPTTS